MDASQSHLAQTLRRQLDKLQEIGNGLEKFRTKKYADLYAQLEKVSALVPPETDFRADEEALQNLQGSLQFSSQEYDNKRVLFEAIRTGGDMTAAVLDARKRNATRELKVLAADLDRHLQQELMPIGKRIQARGTELVKIQAQTKRVRDSAEVVHVEIVDRSRDLSNLLKSVETLGQQQNVRASVPSNTLEQLEAVGSNVYQQISEAQGSMDFFADPLPTLKDYAAANAALLVREQQVETSLRQFSTQVATMQRQLGVLVASKKREAMAADAGPVAMDESAEITGQPSKRGGFASACANIKSRPSIQIFELKPPPTLPASIVGGGAGAIQSWVSSSFRPFYWHRAAAGAEASTGCQRTELTDMNTWQKFAYHYFHPFQHEVGGMLFNASAGSGKSWTIAAINSIFARAGYRVVVATKISLRSELQDAMFKVGADVNVNNMVRGCGIDITEANAKGVVTKKGKKGSRVGAAAEKEDDFTPIEGDFGGDGAGDDDDDDDDNNDISAALGNVGLDSDDDDDDDESPKVEEDKDVPLDDKERARRKALLHRLGRESIGKMGVKWVRRGPNDIMTYEVLAGALGSKKKEDFTKKSMLPDDGEPILHPLQKTLISIDEIHLVVSDSPDLNDKEKGDYLVLLNALLETRDVLKNRKDLWPKVAGYTATSTSVSPYDVILILNLMVSRDRVWLDFYVHKNPDATLKNFLSMYVTADGSLNASGQQKWELLSRGNISFISLYGDASHFAQPVVISTDVELSATQTKNMMCCLKLDTKTNGIKCNKEHRSRANKSLKETRKCFMTELMAPRGIKASTAKGKKQGVGAKNVPNVYELIKLMRMNDLAAQAQLATNNTTGDSALAEKIFLYVPVKQAKPLQVFKEQLKMRHYEPINVASGSNDNMRLVDTKAYHGYIDFTSSLKGRVAKKGPEKYRKYEGMQLKEALLDIYNDKANFDGRNALIFLGSNRYREGISLQGVDSVYMGGPETSRAAQVQAISRGIRFCSSASKPWVPGKGWPIKIFLQRLKWNQQFAAEVGKSVREALDEINPDGAKFGKAMAAMAALTEASSVDRGLFAEISSGGSNAIPFV